MRPDYATPGGAIRSGIPVGPKQMSLLDQLASELVNADEGGSWAPTTQIVLGSSVASVLTITPSSYAAVLKGGVTTRRGCLGIEMASTVRPTFRNAADSADESRDQTVVFPITTLYSQSVTIRTPQRARWIDDHGGIRTRRPSFTYFTPLGPRRIFANATLTSVTLKWRVSTPRTLMPATKPAMHVYRVQPGGAAAALKASAVSPAATTPTAYYNDGLPQDLLYTCDQNNTSLDLGNSLLLEWVEETGANATFGNELISAKLIFTSNTKLHEI